MNSKEQLANTDVPFTLLTQEQTGFSKEGYCIDRYTTQPDGSGDVYYPGQYTTLQNDLSLYAQWRMVDVIDYFDSKEYFEYHYGNVKKKFVRGKYYVLAVGSGANVFLTSHIDYGSGRGSWGSAGGGSGCVISGDVYISETDKVFTLTTGYDSVITKVQCGDLDLLVVADPGKHGYANGIHSVAGGSGGNKELCEPKDFYRINGKSGLTATTIDKPVIYYSYPNVKGGSFARNDVRYGGGEGRGDGYSYTPQYGYLHMERFNEVVFFKDKGDTQPYKELQYVLSGHDAIPPDTNPTKTGYSFQGWDDYTNINMDKNIYAKWTPQTYSITYEENGGTIQSGNITSYTYGIGATLPTDVIRTDYTFMGWYGNLELSGDRIYSIGTQEYGNKTYWAKWKSTSFEGGYWSGSIGVYSMRAKWREDTLDWNGTGIGWFLHIQKENGHYKGGSACDGGGEIWQGNGVSKDLSSTSFKISGFGLNMTVKYTPPDHLNL